MSYLLSLLTTVLFLLGGCDEDPTHPAPPRESFFSFEADMEGWNPNGTDLDLGNTFIEWSITRNQELAKDGNTSIKFDLNNLNDAGKIWIERPFAVQPHRTYHVRIEYAFASADSGDVNNFTILTGVLPKPPRTRDDLIPTYQEDTGNGGHLGYTWLDKKYEWTVRSGGDGTLYVIIGIWGTFEVQRIYYVDSVRVTLFDR